jgi:hypothetical protein
MRYILLILYAIFILGCGSDRIENIEKQNYSDIKAAISSIKDESFDDKQRRIIIATAMNDMLDNIVAINGYEKNELPGPRISRSDWISDTQAAGEGARANAQSDSKEIKEWQASDYALLGGGLLGTLAILLRLAKLLPGPIGMFAGYADMLLVAKSPKKDRIQEDVMDHLDAYKEKDPDWEKNPVFTHLSKSMTQDEKDTLKRMRRDRA